MRLDQGDGSGDRGLHHVAAAVDDARLLAVGQGRAVTGGGEKPADAGATGADALGEGALRYELELDATGAEGLVEVVTVALARKAADHLGDLARSDERGQAVVAVAGVVVDHGEAADVTGHQGLDQLDGLTGLTEPADEDGVAVLDEFDRSGSRFGDLGTHADSLVMTGLGLVLVLDTLSSTTARPWPTPMQMAATP